MHLVGLQHTYGTPYLDFPSSLARECFWLFMDEFRIAVKTQRRHLLVLPRRTSFLLVRKVQRSEFEIPGSSREKSARKNRKCKFGNIEYHYKFLEE